jgi:hypothetical protein
VDHVSHDDDQLTGKRDAARNNSGQTVDHSVPDLGVGPTNSETSGRNPEACPPRSQSIDNDGAGDTDGSDGSRREALDSSQGKSGWGSGGEAPRARARAKLRSEAEQRTSLDSKKINRYTDSLAQLNRQGRRRYCGVRTLKGSSADGRVTRFIRLDCKTWGCAHCGPKKAKRYKAAIRQIAENEQLNRFLTLTLDPRKISGSPVRYLRRIFNKFRVYLLRKFGRSIKYIAVLEFQQNGNPHLHILVDRFIQQHWISQTWSALGGGRIVDIKFVDVHRISRYLSKYLTKELLLSAPPRSRRVTTSRGIHLIEKRVSEIPWRLLELSIFHLYSIHRAETLTEEFDENGLLFRFSIQIGPSDSPTIITLTLARLKDGSFALFLVRQKTRSTN